uniref:Uncharacterized protein n=1 Tax=Pipistrellus kuhlii TaxID=59472 RepID=A0A7J7VV84_PIPKU|nr:hypothetical protein mPipKuh1_008264 [Pipistrellus kuhlii]
MLLSHHCPAREWQMLKTTCCLSHWGLYFRAWGAHARTGSQHQRGAGGRAWAGFSDSLPHRPQSRGLPRVAPGRDESCSCRNLPKALFCQILEGRAGEGRCAGDAILSDKLMLWSPQTVFFLLSLSLSGG